MTALFTGNDALGGACFGFIGAVAKALTEMPDDGEKNGYTRK